MRFRSGTVFSAEISTIKPDVSEENQFTVPPKEVVWAEVVVRLDKGRSLSARDYALKLGAKEFPCYAIAESDRIYSIRDWNFEKTMPLEFYRMLFPVELPPPGDPLIYELKFKLAPSPKPLDVELRFRSMGNKRFTDARSIPREGLLGLTVEELSGAKKTELTP